MVLPAKGTQVVVSGDPHFPQKDRVTTISLIAIESIRREDGGVRCMHVPGFPESPGDTKVLGVPTIYKYQLASH